LNNKAESLDKAKLKSAPASGSSSFDAISAISEVERLQKQLDMDASSDEKQQSLSQASPNDS